MSYPSNAGNNIFQNGIQIDNVDLDDIKACGVYLAIPNHTNTNAPFDMEFSMIVISNCAGVAQIAMQVAGSNVFAIRRCNYMGIWNTWEYFPKRYYEKNHSYTLNDNYNGFISTTGTELNVFVPFGKFAQGITAADLSISTFSLYIATADGIMTHSQSDCYVSNITLYADFVQLTIKKNDNTAFGSTFGRPINATGTIALTIT